MDFGGHPGDENHLERFNRPKSILRFFLCSDP
jgi:hypothetical protein